MLPIRKMDQHNPTISIKIVKTQMKNGMESHPRTNLLKISEMLTIVSLILAIQAIVKELIYKS